MFCAFKNILIGLGFTSYLLLGRTTAWLLVAGEGTVRSVEERVVSILHGRKIEMPAAARSHLPTRMFSVIAALLLCLPEAAAYSHSYNHISKCIEESAGFKITNFFLEPAAPVKGQNVSLEVFYYAPIEIQNPDVYYILEFRDVKLRLTSQACGSKVFLADERIQPPAPVPATKCKISVGYQTDILPISWLWDIKPPLTLTMFYRSRAGNILLCANLLIRPEDAAGPVATQKQRLRGSIKQT